MKAYLFKVELKGIGADISDAWRDAVEAFTCDSGPADDPSKGPICSECEEPWVPRFEDGVAFCSVCGEEE